MGHPPWVAEQRREARREEVGTGALRATEMEGWGRKRKRIRRVEGNVCEDSAQCGKVFLGAAADASAEAT